MAKTPEINKLWRKYFSREITEREVRKMTWAVRARNDGSLAPNIGGSMDASKWVSKLRAMGVVMCARKRASERDGHSRNWPMGGYVASELGEQLFGVER